MSTGRKNVVRVTIAGDEYQIRTDASPEHTLSVAEYLDSAIRQVKSGAQLVEAHKAAILAALQITDELFEARAASGEVHERLRDLGDEVRRVLPPAKRQTGAV